MIVRLTSAQVLALTKSLRGPLSDWWLNQCQTTRADIPTKMIEVSAVPDFWREALDWIIRNCLTSGTIDQKPTANLFGATKRIARAVNERRAHPAFKGEAMVGKHYLILPAWIDPDAGPQPFYFHGDRFVFLVPEYEALKRGLIITTWVEQPSLGSTAEIDTQRFMTAMNADRGSFRVN